MTTLSDIRTDYQKSILQLSDLNPNPICFFKEWLNQAIAANIHEPNAMCISTVDKNAQPDARIVLLKYMDDSRLGFYTNHHSQKAQQIAENPNCALVFFWKELERQVRIKAHLQIMDEQTATDYYQSRPKDSQIAAWASPQSQVITDRQILEDNFIELQQRYQQETLLPKPPNWGGYFIIPHQFEFWQGRSSRLHDRFIYTFANKKNTIDGWLIERLAP